MICTLFLSYPVTCEAYVNIYYSCNSMSDMFEITGIPPYAALLAEIYILKNNIEYLNVLFKK